MGHTLYTSSLLCEFVSWDSRTLTEGERAFAPKLVAKLKELEYFKDDPVRWKCMMLDLAVTQSPLYISIRRLRKQLC